MTSHDDPRPAADSRRQEERDEPPRDPQKHDQEKHDQEKHDWPGRKRSGRLPLLILAIAVVVAGIGAVWYYLSRAIRRPPTTPIPRAAPSPWHPRCWAMSSSC
jgi:hypothetical protein